jgi:predicted KAP-like P-loop ATPase
LSLALKKETLEETRAAVQTEFSKLSAPIAVMVDDLDRLTPAELLEMLQLVKANGDFPNLIYLLLCDRPTVERNIQEAAKAASGREYLEKIVQVAFGVPLLDRKRLQQILFKGLDTLIADKAVSKHFNQTRWGNIFVGGLQHHFSSLRQVNLFLSTFSFHCALFKSGGAFEVNVIDLIALETLRVYEPDFYLALPKNKSLLTGVRDFGRGNRDEERQKSTRYWKVFRQRGPVRFENSSNSSFHQWSGFSEARITVPTGPSDGRGNCGFARKICLTVTSILFCRPAICRKESSSG